MTDRAIDVPSEPPASQPAAPQSPSGVGVFRGPNGIRAGWRALIFLAIVVALVAAVNLVVWLVMHFLLHHTLQTGISSITPSGLSVLEGSIFVLTAVPALIMARIERRKFGELWPPSQIRVPQGLLDRHAGRLSRHQRQLTWNFRAAWISSGRPGDSRQDDRHLHRGVERGLCDGRSWPKNSHSAGIFSSP
jgi:hypothetical protein